MIYDAGEKKVFFLRYKGQVLIKHKRKKNVKCINNIWSATLGHVFWLDDLFLIGVFKKRRSNMCCHI
jgi:hypothetical protein